MQDDFSTSPIEPKSARVQKQEQAEAKQIAIAQEASEQAMIDFGNEAAFSPIAMAKRFKTLEEQNRRRYIDKKEAARSDDASGLIVDRIEEIAEEFEQGNPELKARSLQQLLARLAPRDTPEQILEKTLESYHDPSLADEALEFMDQTTQGELQARIRSAREDLNGAFQREVRAGRNMGKEARAFSQEGLGSSTGLRDLYREITGNPRPATTLFDELSQKFNFTHMQKAIDFLLHSMGADLKAKGPSIAPGQLHALMSEARNLLAILWVYRFFRGRMDLINSSFQKGGMLLPSRMTFELLAKLFVAFLMERYPSMDKVFQLALKLGISTNILAQIIIFTQMRDAVRGVAPKLYRSQQHRHDVLMSLIEALEELEERMEEDAEGEDAEEEG